jgi:hypothetical protein
MPNGCVMQRDDVDVRYDVLTGSRSWCSTWTRNVTSRWGGPVARPGDPASAASDGVGEFRSRRMPHFGFHDVSLNARASLRCASPRVRGTSKKVANTVATTSTRPMCPLERDRYRSSPQDADD